MTTATRSTGRDTLIGELMRDFACETEQELRMRLRTAIAWANEHGVQFGRGFNDVGIRRGEDTAYGYVEVANVAIQVHSSYAALTPAHWRLIRAALALYLFTHPVTRRQVEAGRCVHDED
jgi:hypothetical protein